MILGIDYLGGAKYQKVILEAHPVGFAARVFANTFGNPWKLLDNLARISPNDVPVVGTHAIWDDKHQYIPERDDPIIFKTLSRFEELIDVADPRKEFQFSPFCEHTIKGPEFAGLWNRLNERANPKIKLVNNPLLTGAKRGNLCPKDWGIRNECHGSEKALEGDYQFSFDGLSCVDTDIEMFKQRHAKARVMYFWIPQCNGRKTEDDTTPRPERKAWPTRELIKSLGYLKRPNKSQSFPKGWIWKSHCEQTSVPPGPRDCKPVLIAKQKAKYFTLIDNEGLLAAQSGPALPFSGGGYRYYWPEYGYQMSTGAARLLNDKGKEVGRIDPGFRDGTYRNTNAKD